MKRHLFAFISSLIILLGILCMLLGFAFGGKFGSYQFNHGELYYQTDDEKIILWSRENPATPSIPSSPTTPETPTTPDVPSVTNDAVTIPTESLQKLSIEIDAGYINIVSGDVASLTVEGDMPYKSSFDNGKWNISSDIDSDSIKTDSSDENTHFFLNGKDITTTFTIVVPNTLEKIELSSSLGYTSIDSVTVEKIDVNVAMGTATLDNCTATASELETSMGTIKTNNLISQKCTANSEMGSIILNGTISESFTAESEMGSVIAKITRPSNYSWNADSSMGTIIVDNKKVSSEGQNGNGSGLKLDLYSSMGTVKVIFI